MMSTSITWRRKCQISPLSDSSSFSSFLLSSLEGSHHVQHTLRSGELYSTYLRAEYLINHLELFCMTDSSILPIYLCNQSYGLMDIYVIYWVYNPILLYFVAQNVPSLDEKASISSLFNWILCFFDILSSLCVCVSVCVRVRMHISALP